MLVSTDGQTLFELEQVTESDLTQIFKQAHNSLWGGGELNPSEAFDELDKLIFCKMWDEGKPRIKGEPYDFQIFSKSTEEQTKTALQQRINKLYKEGREKDREVFKDNIRLSKEKLYTVVGYLQGIHLGDTDLDSKGRAFETFMGSFFRGDFGQYFTPRPIVKFIVDTLPINHNSKVLDTSCGSGGFLLHALDKVRKQADDYYNQVTESKQHLLHWHDFAKENLFGIEINEQIARTAKMNMIIHDDGHTNVITADGLLPIDDIKDADGKVTQQGIFSKTKNNGFIYGSFDFIVTNPPFGSSIKQTEQAYMHQYGLAIKEVDWLEPKSKQSKRDSQNTEVLFIEQCYKFLKEGAYLAIVLPDGVLTNSTLQYVRNDIAQKFRIVAVVSMPQSAFQATGAGVKSSVLFLKKHTAEFTEKLQNHKTKLHDDIKDKHKYLEQLAEIEQTKKQHIKNLNGFDNPAGLTGKALSQDPSYREWKACVNAQYREQIDLLKENLSEQYTQQQKAKTIDDYPIFMAIAEDIGYDATGKDTGNNELDFIAEKLSEFIEGIEKGKDSFFV